jgi:hypothetical protein
VAEGDDAVAGEGVGFDEDPAEEVVLAIGVLRFPCISEGNVAGFLLGG